MMMMMMMMMMMTSIMTHLTGGTHSSYFFFFFVLFVFRPLASSSSFCPRGYQAAGVAYDNKAADSFAGLGLCHTADRGCLVKLPFNMHEDHLYLEGSSFTVQPQKVNEDGTTAAEPEGGLAWPLHVVVDEAYSEPVLSRKLAPMNADDEDLEINPLVMLRFEPNLYWYLTAEATGAQRR